MTIKIYRFVPFDRSGWVAWLLEEMGVPFEGVEVDGRAREHLGAEFRKLSPAGKIPAVVDGDQVLFESGAALQALADRYGAGEVAPKIGSGARCDYLCWLYYASATLDPVCFEFVRPDMPEKFVAQRRERARFEVQRLLDTVETQLGEGSTILKWGFSAADIQMAQPLQYAEEGGCLDDRPKLKNYLDALRSRPAARKVQAFPG